MLVNKLYSAFGLVIKSEIALPEMEQEASHKVLVDVTIESGKGLVIKKWKQLRKPNKAFAYSNDGVLFEIDDTAVFYVKGGNKIFFDDLLGYSEQKLRLFLLGTCMGIILLQRGILPLHGSAVEINDKAYLFIGDSGAGKSTLAASFIARGYRLLSDDVIPLTLIANGIPYITPSYPHQKLWKDSLDHFGRNSKDYHPIFQRETKFYVPIGSSFCNKQLPLGGIFELKKSCDETLKIEKIEGLLGFKLLNTHTYRNFLVNKLNIQKWHFSNIVAIVRHAQIYSVQRPDKWFSTETLTNEILSIIHRRV